MPASVFTLVLSLVVHLLLVSLCFLIVPAAHRHVNSSYPRIPAFTAVRTQLSTEHGLAYLHTHSILIVVGVMLYLWDFEEVMGILAGLEFDHGYYIRGTLKRLTDIVARPKAWWIRMSVKQVTDQKSMPLLPRWRGNAHKSHDFGSVWPQILYPWDFEEADGCSGLAQGFMDLCERETSHRPEIHATVALLERKSQQKS
ncbi:hypothetical protein C8R44DRAFT_746259 [Mycena epipterygia]|nr:hypothetical protein C8R44DRAFT_746259 [Mycena epipterygia]